MSAEVGRRERKKAATRKAISDAATLLFIERGFDEVSIREIADAADVSPTTVFAHFPQKEALVFDEDDAQREMLVAAVRDRGPGTSVSDALRDLYRRELLDLAFDPAGAQRRRFMQLIADTPALHDYASRMWLRHEDALAEAIAQTTGQSEPDAETRVYARTVLQLQLLAFEHDDAAATIEAGFRILERGWHEPR
ncbi:MULTISPECIES: TetR/AcrR family transcriptional regulator [Microbacterium]|jgi:AcrR family transcriptional regulator|uniref:TetR family transcriptional regulator n=1 Tax=Microbacterium testaceum TaxID=2033 RepID=A0A2T7WQP0_MICTE|nr:MULTISPECIES: TetR/AcrR family transcriptional regulator [Microbacterium]PTT23084.1 TetR family transcriptional regulator [Microbacterium sp. HMWF026]PVE76869.1 TetR family transcriptional regulator [Microbacterium testaceum]